VRLSILTHVMLVSACGCTTLGPMPAVTGSSPLPAERPNVELQGGAVPGFYLSSTVQELPKGSPIGQAAAMIEPGEAIGLPGAAIGGRWVNGEAGDGYVEPMLRYRRFVDDDQQFAAAATAHGAYASGGERNASYEATRAGLELAFDARLTPISNWVELHIVGTLGAFALFADGNYCLDTQGKYGSDCPEPGDPPVERVRAEANGLFPAVSGGVALDVARHLESVFHGGRVTAMAAGGTMPHVVAGQHTGTKFYGSAGLLAEISFGAP
jgi:hypothetical protein